MWGEFVHLELEGGYLEQISSNNQGDFGDPPYKS